MTKQSGPMEKMRASKENIKELYPPAMESGASLIITLKSQFSESVFVRQNYGKQLSMFKK